MGGNNVNNQSEKSFDKRLTLRSLFEEEFLDRILWQVAYATDLAVALSDYRGDECTDYINYSEFCRYAREGEDPLCKANNATNAFGITQAAVQNKPFIYFCPYGLLMFAIPIVVNGEFIGGFVGGQVRCNDAASEIVQLKNVLPYKENFLDDPVAREKYMQIKSIPYQKYENIAALMESYFRQIIEKRSGNVSSIQLITVIKELDIERKKRDLVEKKSNRYKLASLRTQMNPYFVMNTLISISNMAIIENAVMTNELIKRFADFMQSLFRQNKEIVSLGEEMDMISSYLGIYESQLVNRMNYSLNITDDLRSRKLPAMLVFTLVEQAIYHTVSIPNHHVKIDINAQLIGEYIEIQIKDNRLKENNAFESRRLIMKQIEDIQGVPVNDGLEVVRERMEDYFQDNYEMVIEENEGSECRLRIPLWFEKDYI